MRAAKVHAFDHILGDDAMLLPLCRHRRRQSWARGRGTDHIHNHRGLLYRADGSGFMGAHGLSASGGRHHLHDGLPDLSSTERSVVASLDNGLRTRDGYDPLGIDSTTRDPSRCVSRPEGIVGHSDAAIHGPGHRFGRPLSTLIRTDGRTPLSLVPYLESEMATLTHEQFRVIFLNSEDGCVLGEQSWSGTATEVEVPVDRVVRQAILNASDSLLLAHNHPSGDARPSKQDAELTRNLVKVCKMLHIRVVDHIVVSRNGCFSFRASGYM